MRLEPKPAAALCAATFTLLLIFGAAWPGPGLWLLATALACLAGAAGAWWLDTAPAQRRSAPAQRVAHTPFAAMPRSASAGGGRSASSMLPQRGPDGRWAMPEQVHAAFVLAGCGLLALILFIGGAIGGGGAEAVAELELDANPTVIDRSREGDPSALPTAAALPAAPAAEPAATPAGTAATAQSAATATPPVSQPRPIVVADPKPATPVELKPRESEAAAAPAARTVQHTVVEGDSLYAIALEYDTTVDAITTLNGITSDTILHLGDTLLIPQPDE